MVETAVMSAGGAVRVERDGPVTTVIIHRPAARNAVDGATAVALHDAFAAFDVDPNASVAVLWGDGGTFCAGADLKAIGTPGENKVRPVAAGVPAPMGPTRMRLSKPVIAAVSGYAVAGGLELACWCDLRIVESDTTFGVFCRRWGVPLIDGGTIRLPLLIGMGRALDLILTGRPVGAEEALAIGLATQVVAIGAARGAAQDLAHQLAALPQTCMREDRSSALGSVGLDMAAALEAELAHGRVSLSSSEIGQGVGRFAAGGGRHGGAPGGWSAP